jgi:hypothetical protein
MGRVWLYIISKELTADQLHALAVSGKEFVSAWTAHEQKLTGSFEIFRNRIIIVKVDENVQGASGCSIDKLTRFIKESEQKFGTELLNRMLVAVKVDDAVQVIHSAKIKDLIADGFIGEKTIVYNTAVNTSEELENWEQPVKNTWLSKFLEGV